MLAPTQTKFILTSAPEPSSAPPVASGAVDLVAPAQNAVPLASDLPPELIDTVWRGDQLGGGRAGFVATGFPTLDAELVDGGWPTGCLIEVLQPQPSLLEWRLIGPCLRALVSGGRSVVVIGHPKRPNLVGLRHLGIEEDNLLWIKVDLPSHRLWVSSKSRITAAFIRDSSAGRSLSCSMATGTHPLRRFFLRSHDRTASSRASVACL